MTEPEAAAKQAAYEAKRNAWRAVILALYLAQAAKTEGKT